METRAPSRDELEDFAAWRLVAMTRMPYMAAMLFSLRLVSSQGLGTMAVDKHHRLYIDFEAVRGWGATACGEVLLHEVCHLLGEHAQLADEIGVNPSTFKLWNVAADMQINDDLAAAGCDYIAETGVLPSSYGMPDHQTAARYFSLLRDLMSSTGQGSGSNDSSSAGSSQEQEGPFVGCGSGSGGQPAPSEMDEEDSIDGYAQGASEVERTRVIVATSVAIENYQQASGVGSVPGGIVSMVEAALTPSRTPWNRVLGANLRKMVRTRPGQDRANYAARDRRRSGMVLGGTNKRIVFPGKRSVKPRIAVVRDSSASMCEERLLRVGQEILGLSRSMGIRGSDLLFIDVDVQASQPRPFNRPEDLTTIHGRGGTDMRVGIEAASSLDVSAIVVITDGGTPWPQEPTENIPVVACLIADDQWGETVPDWIEVVEVDHTK